MTKTALVPLTLVFIERIYQALDTVFHSISKHLGLRQKYSATRRSFNSLLGVWKSDETPSLVFDILLAVEISVKSHQVGVKLKDVCET